MRTAWRLPAAALLVFLALTILYVGDRPACLAFLDAINEHPLRTPFIDTRFVTAQAECWRSGIDVYAANPCDPLGRTQDYSPLWLRLPFLALPDAATPALGLGLMALFAAALFLLPWRAATVFEALVSLAAMLSWSSFFALERGNTDLLMFAAVAAFARLAVLAPRWRIAGHGLVLAAGLLKFYPLVLLAFLLRESWRRMLVLGAVAATVLAAFAACFHAELARIGANMADGVFDGMFGARTLPLGLLELWRGENGYTRAAPLLLAVFTTLCLFEAANRARDPVLADRLGRLDPATRSCLLAGAVLGCGIFFGHQNIGYRAIMLLPVVPGLLALGRPGAPSAIVFRVTALLLLLVLWGGALDTTFPGWLAVHLAWWWIITILLSIALAELGGDVVRRFSRARRLPVPGAPAVSAQ